MKEKICPVIETANLREKVKNPPIHNSDQHFLTIFYGCESKSEETRLLWFKSKQTAAQYLRAFADKIESFENSKSYRFSERYVTEELKDLEDK